MMQAGTNLQPVIYPKRSHNLQQSLQLRKIAKELWQMKTGSEQFNYFWKSWLKLQSSL
jgi:hypothetical protein